MKRIHKYLFTAIVLIALSSFSGSAISSNSGIKPINSLCYVMYDAGSSGTRLYIYEKLGDNWTEHEGPKVSALADPVREIRGKRWQDADAVTTEVVNALDDIKKDGPLQDNGKPKWEAFDWETQCNIASASVYATAGMRIAENENRERSQQLWQMLEQKLQVKIGKSVKVNTRTLSGYEEGLYAWLAVRENATNNEFGILEMGGASSQITFPCPECDITDDAVKAVMLGDETIQIYSYSFLGLGQDEAPKTLGFPDSCAYGVGATQTGWKPEQCTQQISVKDTKGIIDPYNFDGDGRRTYDNPTAYNRDIEKWYLTGAFNYMKASNINTCCLNKGDCYNQEYSCFQALYLPMYLQTLQIPVSSDTANVNWTQGATICSINDCLQKANKPVCRWSQQGCLQ